MGYLAIARKWRPNRFEDLVGQEHVVVTLKNAIRLNRVSHAYLFSGARGVGKTSVARIFAKALRCPNVKDAVPCNQCEECAAVAESRSIDVMEIDGASNNGVEAVRSLRENVVYGAADGHYKIYIIDEVHMLSISAFNALLKTLEEPPAHVIFLFATTESQKIPLTILSRCQRFEFRRLSQTQIVDRLQTILAEEKITISEEGLRTIATHSDGSLRDALSLLDQVLSFGNGSEGQGIDNTQVTEALGVKDFNSISLLLTSVLEKDINQILSVVRDVYLSGVEFKHFAERALDELRLLYLVTVAHENKAQISAEELDISNTHWESLQTLSKKTTALELERMGQILSKTANQLGWSSSPRFLLEMAAIRMTKLSNLIQIEQALMSGDKLGAIEEVAEAPKMSAAPTPPVRTTTLKQEIRDPYPPPPPLVPPPTQPMAPSAPMPTSAGAFASDPTAQWKAFVDTVMKKRPLLGALLCHANFKMDASEKGKRVILAFGAGSFYERQATDQKNRTEIEEWLRNFFGRETLLTISNSIDDTVRSLEGTKQAEDSATRKTALENPAVLKAQEILGAEVVDVQIS